ncbi:MAG: type II toxin-antitoxin system HipA family toxin [Candidatus Magnetomorum sp.]|nr:type II toxin-antitoxin system HipA family toxin [Candidatus Magnetomorum sp.]
MKKLDVFFQRDKWDKFIVGQLALNNNRIFFEYDTNFMLKPLYLSPFKLPPEIRFHEHKDRAFGPNFGLFDDSLPDGWGLLLMDRFLTNKGFTTSEISVLDRLAFLGSSTMGSLIYEPPFERQTVDHSICDIHSLAKQSQKIFSGTSNEVIPQLMRAGGSPGGAWPKILVGIHGDKIISGENDLPDAYEHWMIKFSSMGASNDSGAVEYAYSLMAKAANIHMTETRLFHTDQKDHFFGIKRFDRQGSRRFHVHTFGNLIHANFRIPSCDYEQFLKVVRILTANHQDVKRGFSQMVFNVLANNRDDHVKNFAFIMDDDGEWALSPAYDLTFAHGPGGEHSMTLLQEGRSPHKKEIQQLGKIAGLNDKEIKSSIEQVINAVEQWRKYAQIAGVSNKSQKEITSVIQKNLTTVLCR